MPIFIDGKIKKMEKKWEISFDEMARLAREDPAKFMQEKKRIFMEQFPDLPEDRIDKILRAFDADGGGGDPIELIVKNMSDALGLIGNMGEESRSCVEVGADTVAGMVGKTIENLEKIKAATMSINETIATKEAAQIPEEKKH